MKSSILVILSIICAGTLAGPAKFRSIGSHFHFRYSVPLETNSTQTQIWKGQEKEICTVQVKEETKYTSISSQKIFTIGSSETHHGPNKRYHTFELESEDLILIIHCDNIIDMWEDHLTLIVNTFGQFPNHPHITGSYGTATLPGAPEGPPPEPQSCSNQLAKFCFRRSYYGNSCQSISEAACRLNANSHICVPQVFEEEYSKLSDKDLNIALNHSIKRCQSTDFVTIQQ